jgi:hypothetical protein
MWESRLSGSERAIGKGEMSCTSNQSLWLLDRGYSLRFEFPGRCPDEYTHFAAWVGRTDMPLQRPWSAQGE